MVDCDESYSYVSYHNDIDCSELLFVRKYFTGLQALLQKNICADVNLLNGKIVINCIRELPPMYEHTKRGGYFNENTMKHSYSYIELFAKPEIDIYRSEMDLRINGWECKGDCMIIQPSINGICSSNQIIFANESLFIIHVYDVNDHNCLDEPIAIHYMELDKLISFNPKNQNETDICSDVYIGSSLDYFYRKFIQSDDYSISKYKNNLAIIPNIDCEMDDNVLSELIIEYKKNPIRNFMISHQNLCLSKDNFFIFSGPEFNDGQGIRGYCEDGIPKIFYYGENEGFGNCEGTPIDISNATKNNGICMDSHFFTCLNYICFGKEAVNPNVCNRLGECIQNDYCKCEDGFSGNECEINVSDLTAVSIAVIFSSFVSLFVIFLFIIILFFFWYLLVNSKKKLKIFEGIDDIDVILSEQKLEKKTSIKQIRFNKASFEIQRKDLEFNE